jgi:uncharacterized protein YbcI
VTVHTHDQPPLDGAVSGSVRSELATAMVQLNREIYGRGPTRARVSISDDAVVVVLEDALTTIERALLAEGQPKMVGEIRERTGVIKKEPFVRAVEEITGRRVRAFVTGFNEDPPIVIDTFVLEPRARDR